MALDRRRQLAINESTYLVDLTGVDPGEVMSKRHTATAAEDSSPSDNRSERRPLLNSGVSGISSVSSTTASRRLTAAEKLNRDFLFGETTLPDDLDPEWSFISYKNAGKRISHATGILDTLAHLIRGNVGPGLLSLAYAISNGGYVLGPVALLCVGITAIHCMGLLLDSARTLCEWNGIQALDYAETMYFAVRERSSSKKLSKTAKILVNIFLVITQLGFCSVYFVFLGETLHQVMNVVYCIDLDHRIWSAILIPIITVFSWIRNLDNLAPLSLVANIGIFFGLFVIVCDEVFKLSTTGEDQAMVTKDISQLNAFTTFSKTCLFFGNAIYAFEGIGVVLPLENKMKKPAHAKRVVFSGMTFTLTLFVTFSTLGYLVYGDRVQGSIHLNLCGTSALTTSVFMIAKLGISVAIFTSYMLMFYVPMDFMEPYVYKMLRLDVLTYKYPKHHGMIKSCIQMVFRMMIVLLTAILAITIPNLDNLITLVGAFACSCLSLIFPPLIDLMTFWNNSERKFFWVLPRPVWIAKDFVIMAFGILGFIIGTVSALYNIIMTYEGKRPTMDPCGSDLFACPYYK